MEDIKIQFLNFLFMFGFLFILKKGGGELLFFEKGGAVIARKTDLRFYN